MTTDTMQAAIQGWPEEDVQWLSTVPDKLQPIAQRHGRRIFQLAMQAGISGHALGILGRQGRNNRAILGAIHMLAGILDSLVLQQLQDNGWPPQAVLACKKDIELIHDLTNAGGAGPGQALSKGGIILNS